MIHDHHRRVYRQTRKTKGAALIHCEGFHGLSDETLAELEHDYQRTAPYACCKWCGIETSILKTHAHVCGVACSEDCERELREHYT